MKRHSFIYPCRNKTFLPFSQYSIMIIFIFTAGEVERPGNGFCFLSDGADKWFHLIWASPITFPSFVAILNHFLLFCAFTKIREIEMLWRIKLKDTCTDAYSYIGYLALMKNYLQQEVTLSFLSLPSLLLWLCSPSDISLLTLQQFERKKNHCSFSSQGQEQYFSLILYNRFASNFLWLQLSVL